MQQIELANDINKAFGALRQVLYVQGIYICFSNVSNILWAPGLYVNIGYSIIVGGLREGSFHEAHACIAHAQ